MGETDFEAPLLALERRIEELAAFPGDPAKAKEAARLRAELDAQRREVFAGLDAWQKTLVARNPGRPYTLDYVQALFADWTEVHGDRSFGEDPALVCGLARFRGRPVALIGHQKGRDTKQKIFRNFGMPKPEGYRKALRAMHLAEKFQLPILCFVDTPGAYPGMDAEERGQAEAIARNLREMARIRTPIIVNITGEGGSGGALAIAIGDRINMLEHAIYSVISPEGCASILWRDAGKAPQAANAMKITAADLARFGIVDEVVAEPPGGAHRDWETQFETLARVMEAQLGELTGVDPEALLAARYQKFRRMGAVGQEIVEVAN